MRGWRVHTGFTVGRGPVGEEAGGGVAGLCWFHCRLRLWRTFDSSWIHCRLRLSRKGEDVGFLLESQ